MEGDARRAPRRHGSGAGMCSNHCRHVCSVASKRHPCMAVPGNVGMAAVMPGKWVSAKVLLWGPAADHLLSCAVHYSKAAAALVGALHTASVDCQSNGPIYLSPLDPFKAAARSKNRWLPAGQAQRRRCGSAALTQTPSSADFTRHCGTLVLSIHTQPSSPGRDCRQSNQPSARWRPASGSDAAADHHAAALSPGVPLPPPGGPLHRPQTARRRAARSPAAQLCRRCRQPRWRLYPAAAAPPEGPALAASTSRTSHRASGSDNRTAAPACCAASRARGCGACGQGPAVAQASGLS